MNEEFMSFEQACRELGVDATELKRLVSDDEIRAFRDKGQTVFKKEDIRALKDALTQQPVIVPSGGEGMEEGPPAEAETGGEEKFEETVLNIEGLGDIDLGADLTGPTVETKPPQEETFATIEEEAPSEATQKFTPEKGMRDTIRMPEAAAEEEETFVLSETDLGKETESLELLDETATAAGAPPRTAAHAAAAEAPFAAAYPEAAPADKVTIALLIITICVMAVGLFASIGFLLQQGNAVLDILAGK
jgi:hypothetical protein